MRVIQRGFRYRLSPTAEQASALWQTAGVTRFIYNLALEQRRTFGVRYREQTGTALNYISQGRDLTKLRAEVDWIGAEHSTPGQQALRDLDKAFRNFFTGAARYPQPRRKGVNDSFRLGRRDFRIERLNSRWSKVRLPKAGWVKFRHTRDLRGRITSATIARGALGWHISVACEIEHEAVPSILPAVGIDRGVSNTLALSTGELLSNPDTSRLERRRKRAQRILARRRRGSNRYRKQRVALGQTTAKIGRVRADWRHRTTFGIATRFGHVGIERLNTVAMTRAANGRRSLNRDIREQGWHAIERALEYKLTERGGSLVKVNPAYTSQQCSSCGTIDKASRESQASYACRSCGFRDHADINAAKNILRRSTASMRVEGCGYAPVETRTADHVRAA